MDTRTAAETALELSFEAMKDQGAAALRGKAWDAFAVKGLPNKRVEFLALYGFARRFAQYRAAPPSFGCVAGA